MNVLCSKETKPAWAEIVLPARRGASYLLASPARPRQDPLRPDPTLRDHLSLASVSRTLRACYYTPLVPPSYAQPSSTLWSGLTNLRPHTVAGQPATTTEKGKEKVAEVRAVNRIWTNGVRVDPLEMEVIGREEQEAVENGGKGKKRAYKEEETGWEGRVIVSYEMERAALLISTTRLTKTDAKKHYKLTDKELDLLRCIVKPNPFARKIGAPMRLYNEAAVESLAWRLHHDEKGHKAFLAKRLASSEKAADTRVKNGSSSKKKKKDKDPLDAYAELLAMGFYGGGAAGGSGGYDGHGEWV
ncbi:hypothetical protein JCM8547_006052 [Rhodosporidiobolus lusitaniae]